MGAGIDLATALLKTLVRPDDQVRIVEEDPVLAERWRSAGAHVAPGLDDDPDLVSRAAEGARTVVLCDESCSQEVLESLAEEAVKDRRIVVWAELGRLDPAPLRAGSAQHIWLSGSHRRRDWGRRKALSYEEIARVIDAADDLEGAPRWELDLTDPASWERLGLTRPRR